MTIETLHLIATYALLSVGTTGLWLGEPESAPLYPVVAVGGAIAAYFFTDRLGIVRLSSRVSNAFGVVIMIRVLWEVARDLSALVLALAHFLVYLQVVKCFRPKAANDFWQLYVINLLQMTIACVINRDLEFGALLVVYLMLALWTLAIFQWRLRAERVGERHSLAPSPIVRRLAWQCAALGLSSAPFALGTFWLIPRGEQFEASTESLSPVMQRLLTGFSEGVRLNERSEILQSDEVALTVWARNAAGAPVELPDDVLWRGSTMVRYSKGAWKTTPERMWTSQAFRAWEKLDALRPGQALLEIEQAPGAFPTLFCPRPLHACVMKTRGVAQYSRYEGCLRQIDFQPAKNERRAVVYSIVTDFARATTRDADEGTPPTWYLNEARSIPISLSRLRATALELVDGIPASDVDGRIERIRGYLMNSGEFEYTLDIPRVDERLDPIEDFLFNHQSGHCEYFASALALMLRAARVPTRLVNGYKGIDYNATGGYYQIRQLLAHAWVEAYVPDASGGHWRTLDPTPVDARGVDVSRRRSWFQPIKEVADAARRWYGASIVGYSRDTQELVVVEAIDFFQTRSWRSLPDWKVSLPGFGQLSVPAGAVAWTLVVILATAVAAAAAALGKRWGWSFACLSWRRADSTRTHLYYRWERWAAGRGWRRQPSQTPWEFAQSMRDRWRREERLAPFADFPLQLVEDYYAAKYGGSVCPANDVGVLHSRFAELERI